MSREFPDRPFVGLGVVVLRSGADGTEVLLARRGKAPNLGHWSLPGGAQELGETAEAGARRELREECGIGVGPLQLAANVDSIHREPDGRVRYHYTIVDFAGLWLGDVAVAGDDVAEVAWVPVAALGPYSLWSEAHRVVAIAQQLLGC